MPKSRLKKTLRKVKRAVPKKAPVPKKRTSVAMKPNVSRALSSMKGSIPKPGRVGPPGGMAMKKKPTPRGPSTAAKSRPKRKR